MKINKLKIGSHLPKKDKSGYYMLITLELYERLIKSKKDLKKAKHYIDLEYK